MINKRLLERKRNIISMGLYNNSVNIKIPLMMKMRMFSLLLIILKHYYCLLRHEKHFSNDLIKFPCGGIMLLDILSSHFPDN